MERKLAFVRSAIEQMQGELRVLETQVSFSTITVSINEPGAVGSFSETIGGRRGSAVDAGVSGPFSLTSIRISAFISPLPSIVGAVLLYDLVRRPLRRRAA